MNKEINVVSVSDFWRYSYSSFDNQTKNINKHLLSLFFNYENFGFQINGFKVNKI